MIQLVLAAVDASQRAAGVVRAALELACPFNAALCLLRAVHVPPEFDAPDSRQHELSEQAMARASADLQRLTDEGAGLVATSILVRQGRPWRVIVDVADELQADVVVVGGPGRHTLERLLGTTAGRVANLVRTSVLIVHDVSRTPVEPAFPYRT
jgi:nucleotide-binding universal stress UspA family protein